MENVFKIMFLLDGKMLILTENSEKSKKILGNSRVIRVLNRLPYNLNTGFHY